jgi:thymidylate kinase
MTTGAVFNAFFQQLEREGIPAVVLHSYADFPDVVKSDVDYAVPHTALAELPRIEQAVAARCGWVVAQRFEHETTACSAILANPRRPGEAIMLDAASHYARNGCVFLPDTDLLEGRQPHREFFIPHPATEFIYVWAKIFAKGKQAEPYLPRLRELYQAAPDRSERLFAKLFGPELGPARDWLNRPGTEWAQLDRALHQRSRFTLTQRVGNAARLLRRLRRPTGLTIAFLGPDGTGKSTVIGRVSELLRPCFRRQLAIHFNPRFGAPTATPPVTDPQARAPRSAPASWAKILFYFARHWAHWLLVQTPARVRSTLIIYDRTFIDLQVDPRRYRVQRSAWLVAALARVLPQPDLTFILDAPAAVIHQRKGELRPEEIERQRAALRPLAQDSARVMIVSTEATPDAVSETVARRVLTLLAARQARRS